MVPPGFLEEGISRLWCIPLRIQTANGSFANLADLGDAPINPMSKDDSIGMIEECFRKIGKVDIVPIAVGGDRTIPSPMLRALAD